MNDQFNPMNVPEPWMTYDSIVLSKVMYGKELGQREWFTTFKDFAAQETHSLLKGRTEGSAGLVNCNMTTADKTAWPMDAFSIGVNFKAPGTRNLSQCDSQGKIIIADIYSAHYWETIFPTFCAIQFKVGNDIVAEGPALDFPPGYGATGGGAGWSQGESLTNLQDPAYLNYAATQGTPAMKNRRQFFDTLDIPKGEILECLLVVSKAARTFLADLGGPYGYTIPTKNADPEVFSNPPARYKIVVSLKGIRYVQQRGALHA